MGAGERCCGDDPLDRHGGIGQRDIVAHRAVEQHVVLQHDADLPTQPGRIDLRKVDPVDEHPAALGHVEALDELGERALARAGRADDADDLAGGHVQTDVVQNFRPVDAIAEGDMLER